MIPGCQTWQTEVLRGLHVGSLSVVSRQEVHLLAREYKGTRLSFVKWTPPG